MLGGSGAADVLINLHASPPPFFSRFEKLAEIVGDAEDNVSAGRERWRFYVSRGYPMNRMALKIPNRDSSGNRFQIVTDPHTPGNQGQTYAGRPDVPGGETFSREAEWPPAGQLPPALSTGTYGGW